MFMRNFIQMKSRKKRAEDISFIFNPTNSRSVFLVKNQHCTGKMCNREGKTNVAVTILIGGVCGRAEKYHYHYTNIDLIDKRLIIPVGKVELRQQRLTDGAQSQQDTTPRIISHQ